MLACRSRGVRLGSGYLVTSSMAPLFDNVQAATVSIIMATTGTIYTAEAIGTAGAIT